MDLKLDGKTALVTGSGKGIGKAIAMGLAREGASVVVHGRDGERTRRVAEAIVEQGGRAHAVLGDLTRDKDVEHLVAEAERLAGPIQILVNNAGGSGPKDDWRDTASATWAATFDRNVLAAVRVATRLLPGMRRLRWGRIITISSAAATMPPPTGPDYAAAKAAMNAMTASMAKGVASDGITVNTISPGTIRSPRAEDAFRDAAEKRGMARDAPWREVEREVLPLFAQVPLGRVGDMDEVADAVAFLASPRAGYITGINLRVDGAPLPCPDV